MIQQQMNLKKELITVKDLKQKSSHLEKSNKWYEETLQVFEEQENEFKKEIIELRTQLENTRGEKEVEVTILEGKLAEKDKQLRFQYCSMILENILSNQMYPSIKFALGFLENEKGESSSQACEAIIRLSKKILKNQWKVN